MCFEFDALPPYVPADRVLPLMSGGAAAEKVTLTSADGTNFGAAFAQCPQPIGSTAIVVLPDVRGLYRFYIDLAERFVTAGYHALAIDYFGRTAGTEERDDEFDAMSHTMKTTTHNVQADIAAAREFLAEHTDATSFVTVGFCFGGAQSDLVATLPGFGIDAAISFYGTLNPARAGITSEDFPAPLPQAGATSIPVLALFGGADPMNPEEDVSAFEAALTASGVAHEVHTYPGAPHSFFDRSAEEYADASQDAWHRVLDFLAAVPA